MPRISQVRWIALIGDGLGGGVDTNHFGRGIGLSALPALFGHGRAGQDRMSKLGR